MFTPTQIEERVKEQPFKPLRIVMSSGESFEIRHPDLIMIGKKTVAVGVSSSESSKYYDGLNRIAIAHLTAIEDIAASSSDNGA